MDDSPLGAFFLQPSSPRQRRYEALRRVFVEHPPQEEVARHFGYSYAAFRQLVHQFRRAQAAGRTPPFSSPPAGVGSPRKTRHGPGILARRPSPTHAC